MDYIHEDITVDKVLEYKEKNSLPLNSWEEILAVKNAQNA